MTFRVGITLPMDPADHQRLVTNLVRNRPKLQPIGTLMRHKPPIVYLKLDATCTTSAILTAIGEVRHAHVDEFGPGIATDTGPVDVTARRVVGHRERPAMRGGALLLLNELVARAQVDSEAQRNEVQTRRARRR